MTIRRFIPWEDIALYEGEACADGWARGLRARTAEGLDLAAGHLTGGDTGWLRARWVISRREEYAADQVGGEYSWEEAVALSRVRRYVPIPDDEEIRGAIPNEVIVTMDGVECADLARGLLDGETTGLLRDLGIISSLEEQLADWVGDEDDPVAMYEEAMR